MQNNLKDNKMRAITKLSIEEKIDSEWDNVSMPLEQNPYENIHHYKLEEVLNLDLECKPVYIYINKKTRLLDWCFKGQKLEKSGQSSPAHPLPPTLTPIDPQPIDPTKPLYEQPNCQVVHISIMPKTLDEAQAYFAYYLWCFIQKNPHIVANKNFPHSLVEHGKILWQADFSIC